ncbi:MAG: hypothetical protein AABX52_01130 [Nanoarchaeota archaeon]
MASQALEQMLEFAPTIGQERTYGTIDTYTKGTTVLYSFDPPRTFNSIGSMDSGFQLGGPGNIRRDIGYGLQERYDFSGHNGFEPHINYDLIGTNINLGPSHHINLDIFKEYQE